MCADKFTFQVIQVREQVFDTRTTSEKEDRQSSCYFSFLLLGNGSLESRLSLSVAFALRHEYSELAFRKCGSTYSSRGNAINLNFVDKIGRDFNPGGEKTCVVKYVNSLHTVITILITEGRGVDKKIKRVYNAITKIINLLPAI